MKIKPDVSIQGLKPEMIIAVIIANDIYNGLGFDMVLTSVTEGKHSYKSRHRIGMAIDLRTHYFSDATKKAVFNALKDALGAEYFILSESTHFHIEYRGVQ